MQKPNRHSTANWIKHLFHINGPSGVLVSMEEMPSQRDTFWDDSWRLLLRWLNGQVAGGRLFQREGAHESKALAPVLVLTPGTDRMISLFDLSDMDGIFTPFLPHHCHPTALGIWALWKFDWLIDWVMWQTWSEDTQVAFHNEFCRSANRSWTPL